MVGALDMRAVSGLKKLLSRWANKDQDAEKNADYLRLRTFYTTVKVAESMRPALCETMDDSELDICIARLDQEKVIYPLEVQTALLTRRVRKMVASNDVVGLVTTINPFGHGAFSPSAPSVAGLASSQKQKLMTFHDVFFEQVLTGAISSGESEKHRVQRLAAACTQIIG